MLRYLASGRRELGDFPMPPHMRVNWEFLAVVRGRLAPTIPGHERLPLRKDTLWLFPPGYVHGWKGVPGEICEIIVIHFSVVPPALEQVVGLHGFLSGKLAPAQKRKLAGIVRELKPHYSKPVLMSELVADRAATDLGLVLLERHTEGRQPHLSGASWSKVLDAEKWMREHVGESPSVAQVAAAVGLSPSQLRRVYQKIRKRNPKRFLDKLRLDRAMHLMAESDFKLERIAAESGFSTAANFCRAFKAIVGRSPTTWRKEIYIQYKRPKEGEKAQYQLHGRRYREL